MKTYDEYGPGNPSSDLMNRPSSSIITYCDKNILESFDAKLDGSISKYVKGKGWGYDPIFIPNNLKKTFAELNNKNELSHRYKALKKFSKWYLYK